MASSPDASSSNPPENKYPGYRLGLPETGPRSIARFWRRLVALFFDWGIALGISAVWFESSPVATSLAFWGHTSLVMLFAGGSVGHLVFGMYLTRTNGEQIGVWRPILRQFLLTLVLPAAIWDTDQRGGHDIIAGTVLHRR